MGDRNITKEERVFMEVSKQDDVKKSNKQWLRYGATSVLVALGMGAGAVPNVTANETTAGSQPGAFATSESDESVETPDTDDRDKDGDGRDDETGEPVAAESADESSAEVTQEPNNESEETPAETPQEEPVVAPETTETSQQESGASEADTSTPVAETPADTEIAETPENVETPTNDVAVEPETSETDTVPETIVSTEPSAPSEVAETPTSEESELSSITSESSEASSSASSEKVTENSEAGDVSTNESETSQTDVESVSEASSDETESETETPEEDTSTAELGEGTDVTVMQEPVANPAAETATAEKVVTVSDPGTYAADEIIQVANAFDGNAPVEFKATDYGIDETVTVTYEDNRFLWINMSLNAKLNNVDMTALKAFAVRNRLNIAFTQEGERPKDATTGLTDTQQASLDLFNKEAFNLREETQVSNEAGTLLVYWPTRGDAYSDAFDTTDHSDVSHFADKIDMPWIVASASEMRMAAGQNPSPGDSVTDSPNLPAGIKGNTALLQAYMPIEAVIGTDNRTYMLMVARPGVTKDDTGKAVTPLQTMIAIQYSSSGTGTRTYITSTAESGYAGNVAGMTITNNYANGNWGYNITNAIAVGDGNGKTDGAPADTKTRTNWLRYSNTNSTAEVRYYVKQADGTFKEINGPIAGAPTSSDAHNNPLYGGSSPYYSDQFTFTTDSLPGYKLIDSMTQVSGKNVQISSPNAAGQMTITGQFSGTDYDKMNGINWYESAALYSALLNPNSPFDLATVQALFPDLNLTKIPKGATLYTIAKGSSTATWINWPVVDANGNIVTEQRASFISDGTMNRTNSSVLQLYTTQSVTAAQSSASAAAGNPVWPTDTSGYADSTVRKDVSLSTAVLSYYLSADGKTVKASSTAISGYTKITGNLYRDTSGKYTTSATDALGNPNQLAAVVPDYLDSDADGKIDSNFAFRTGGTDASAYATYGTRLSVPSGVSLYFEAIPQNATVDYQTATVDSSGKITLTTNKVPNKTQATLTAVTGDQIGVPVQGDTTTNNSWSAKANATAPAGYTYVGFTYNGGALQSVKKSDGTIAMPNEVNTVKYTSTAINGATESDDKIVLYYVAVQQTANVTFSYQTGSTGPAISSASTTGNSSATINATNGSAAKGNTTIVLDANGINVVAAIPKGYHVVSSAMTSGTGLTYSDTTKTITGAFDATANGSSGTDSTQQTINLVLAADSQTANVVVSTTSASTPTYKAGASVDKATGESTTKITFATASDTTLKQAGYTYTVTGPDGVVYATLAAAMAATPNYDTTANGSSTTDATPQTFTVTYVADKQTANVVISSSSATTPKYAAGAKVDTVSGDSNTKITFATASDTALKQAGYSYTVTGPDGKTYATLALAQAAVPNFDATDNNGSATDGTQQNFTVNYTIDKQTANVTVSSTSDTTPKYAAGAKVDTATGGSSSKISFTTASDTNLKQAGYTYTVTGPDGVVYPTLAAAMAATPNYDTTSNGTSTTDATPQNFTVTYKADTQSIQINFKMADGSTPPASITASGKTGAAIAQTVTAPAGYHFATTAEISANPSYAVATTGTKVLKFDGVSSVTGSYDDTNNNGATTDSSPQTMTLTLVPDKQEIQIKFVVDRGTATAPSNISVSGASNAALDSKSTMTVQSGVTLTDGGVTITAPKIPTGYSIDVAATNADAANTAGKLTFTSDGLTATVSGMYDTTANGAATTDGTPQVYVIHLVQDDAKVNVVYIDVDGSTKTTGFTPSDGAEVPALAQALKGGAGQSYSNTLSDYEKLGYVLATQDAGATSGTYDMVPDDASTSQTYYVYLKHDTTTVTPSTPGEPGQPVNPDNPDSPLYPADNTAYKTTQEIKQITNYVVTDGGVANPPSYTQTTNWGREVTLDKVTGEVISATDWQVLSENDNGSDVTSADDDWHAVDSPVIDGYYADKAVIPAETITQDSFASTDYTQTNTVTYTKLGNYVPSFPDDTTVPSVPYGNDPDDPTSPSTPSIPYVPGYTPHDPDGNPLTPIDPEDPEKGYVPPTPKNPGQDTPINYTADEQVAEVIYIDDTTGQQLRKDALNGKTNQTSTYLTADQIAAYVAAGYTFVSDDTPNPLVFDDVADFDSEGYPIKTSQIYEVHLKQVVVTVDPSSPLNPGDNPFTPGDPVDPSDPSSPTYPSTPGEPGQPVDPSNPSGPTWPATPTAPEGLQEQDLNKTVTRTIHYWYTAVNGEKVQEDVVQTVQYAREGYLNAVTGAVTYGAWQAVATDGTDDTLDAVNSPVKTGWVADKPSVAAVTNPVGTTTGDANDTKISALKDTEENVVYTKMGQYVPSIPANPGGSTPSTPEPITYPNDPDDPTEPREPDPSGEPGTPDNPTIPYVPGYTPNDPNEPHNPLVPVDPDDPSKGYWPPATPEDPTKDTVIVYTPDDQKAQVTYIDQDTGLSLAIDPLVGDTNTKSDYTTVERIRAFEQQGYVLVSDGFTAANPDGLTFDANTGTVQEYEVYLKHVVLTIEPDDPQNPSTPVFNPGDPVDPDNPSGPTYPATPGTPGEPIDPDNPSGPTWPATPTYPDGLKATDLNNTVDLTVHYVYEDGQMAHEDYTDNVKFTRTATLDTVTGKVTYSEWTPVNADNLLDTHKSPVIEGYYASAEYSTAVTAAALDKPYEQTITYKKLGAYVPSFPDTVTDVPSDPQQYPNDPDDPTTPLEPDGNPNTPGSPDNPTLPYVPGYTPEDPNGDPLKPVDPENPSKGYWPPATPGSPVDPTDPNSPTVPGNPGDDTTIKYVADEQKVTIQYYDDDSKTMLAADDVFGDSDTTVDYTTAERIKAYEQAGYILVTDGFTTADGRKYDHDTATDQVFTVHLKQSTVTVDPSTPGEPGDPVFTPGDPIDPANPSGPTYPAEPGDPGEPIDPANPSGPTWPETPTYPTGLSQTDLNKTVTRTIRYWITKVDGTKAAETVTQTVTYSRVAHYNPITQAITYDPWIASETDGTNTTLDEVVSPVVAGYVADKPSVGATTYATGSASGDANDQAISDAPVSTIVDVIYMPLGSYVPSFPAGEKTPSVPEVPYGNNPDDPTTPAEPGEPGSPTLPYVPGYTPSSPNGPVTPIYPGDPVDPSDPSSPTYPENPDKPDTPIGYTPPATPSDPATDTPIIYNADKQYATVTFIDDDTKQTLAVDKLSGGSNTRSTYLTDDKIKAYEAAGYTLVSDDYPDGGMVFDDDGKVNQSYTVHLKHTTVTVDPSSPQDPSTPIYDNPSDPESPNYPGDTTPGDPGTPVNPDAPTYPDTPGTPGDPVDPSDPSSPTYPGVPGTPVFPDDPSSPTYPSTPVTPGDPVDPSDPSSPTYPGVPGTPVDPNTPTWPATPTYPAGVDQKSLNETVTRTITYTYLTEDGDEAAPTYTNSSSFSRVATVDTVTGKVTYGNWVVLDNDDAFGEVISPVIDGYYASIASIGRTDGLTADSPDEVYHVVYKKLGAYVPSIPSTPGSTSVPATPDPITYPNDPNDPTTPENASSPDNPGGYVPGEPTDPTDPDSEKTPSIPYVPGYTPHGPNGDPLVPVDPDNPSSGYYPPATPGSPINPGDPNSPTVPGDPGTDTPIIYEANKQYATITFIDDTTGKTLTVDAIAGPSNSTSSYSTADKIKAYEAAGYVYVSDNYPKDFAFDNDDQTTQAYEVHLTHAIKTLDPSTPGDPSTPIYEPGDPIDPNDPSSPTYPDQPGEPGTPVNPDAPTYPAEPGTPGEPIDPTDPSSPTYPGVPGTPVFPNDPDSPLYPETPVTPGDPIDPADPSSPTYPGVPGTPVDPNTPTWPATPTYPAGVTESDLNETVTRTITYSYAKDGKKAAEPVTQTLTYSRTVSIDAVTGEKTYGEWQPAVGTTLAEVKSPVITGYTANMASVAAIENVDALDADTTVAVVYTAMGQYVPEFPPGTASVPTAPITYPNDPVDPTEPIDPGTYTPGDPVDENDPSSPTYPATPTLPYVPGFTPGAPTDPADPSSPTTPLTPIYPGDPVDPSDPDSPTYPENPDDPDTPIGYTPPATPSDPTTDTPIVYEANEQKASVTYYDDTTGTTLVVDQLTGESDTTSTYWTADRIRAFEAAGYELVSDDYPTDGVTFDRDDKVDQAFEVHLKQIVVTVDPSQPVDPSTPIFTPGEPINPDDPSSPTYPAAPGEPGTPVSPYTPTYPGTPGDPVDPSDPSSPTYPGTPGEPVDPSDPSSPTYPAPGDPVDPSDPSSPTVPTPGTPVDPSDPSSPTYPGIPGTPVDPNSPTWPATPTYPAGLQKDDLNKTVTRTITYVYENGDEAAKTVVDTVSFTRSATVNTVTGAVTYSDWQAVNDDTSFDAVKSPLISGYYATIELVAATTGLTQDSGNENYKVVYRELGAWVPSFPAGTTDVPSEPQQYPNDPADPTSPLDSGKDNPSQPGTPANPTLPYVPGFTPHAPGTPVDPDAPTWPGVPGTPVDPSDPDSPTYPDTPVTPGDPIDPSNPSSPTYPGVPGTPVDPSDPDSPTYPAEPGIPGSPLDPDTPTQPGAPLTPVDPEDPTKGYWPPDVPTNPGADTNIVYTANEQKATVTYIDDDTGATLAVDHLVGQSDKKSPYLTADQITAFETAGYQVVSDNYPKTGMTFDRDDAKDQAYVVHLKQMTVTVEPDDPKDPSTPMFTPGDPVDPNDPKSPTYPQYPGTPGTPIDPATPTYPADPGTPGEPVDPSDPSSPTYPGVPGTPVFPSDPSSPTYPETPVTPGDPVDPSDPSSPTYPVVPGTPIDPNTPTWPATPTYPAGVQEADLNKTVTRTITYTYLTIDGRTAAETVTDSVKFTRQGIVNAITGAVTYTQWQAVNDDTTFAAVKSPVISGYYASAASVAATTGLQATSANETHHVIYQPFGSWIPSVPVDAPSVPADPAGYPNDPNNPDKPMQPGDNPNTPGTPENPTMPYVPGYTPQDPDGHPLVPVDPKDPSKGYVPPAPKDPGKDTVVTYKIDSQKATITFVDETTGKTLNVTNVGGKSGEKSVYTPAAQLAAYEKQGYELVSSDFPDSGIMFDRDKAVDQHYKLVLKHKMVPIDPANPGVPGTPIDPNNPDGPKWPAGSDEDHLKTSTTRTIIFRTSDGKIVDTKTDTVTYTRTAIVDMVTGEVTYGPWTAEDGSRVPGVDVPGMPGYTADRDNVPGEDVPAGTPDYTEYVTYTPVEKHGPAIVDSNTPSQPEPGSPVTPGDPAQPGVVEQTIVPEVLMPNVGGSLAYTATQPAGSVAESGAALAYTAEQSAAASATAQHSGVLPYTGVDDQEGAKATGLAMLFGLFLGLFKRRKKNDEEDQNKSEKR